MGLGGAFVKVLQRTKDLKMVTMSAAAINLMILSELHRLLKFRFNIPFVLEEFWEFGNEKRKIPLILLDHAF